MGRRPPRIKRRYMKGRTGSIDFENPKGGNTSRYRNKEKVQQKNIGKVKVGLEAGEGLSRGQESAQGHPLGVGGGDEVERQEKNLRDGHHLWRVKSSSTKEV